MISATAFLTRPPFLGSSFAWQEAARSKTAAMQRTTCLPAMAEELVIWRSRKKGDENCKQETGGRRRICKRIWVANSGPDRRPGRRWPHCSQLSWGGQISPALVTRGDLATGLTMFCPPILRYAQSVGGPTNQHAGMAAGCVRGAACRHLGALTWWCVSAPLGGLIPTGKTMDDYNLQPTWQPRTVLFRSSSNWADKR